MTEPGALAVWAGETGRPEPRGRTRCTPSKPHTEPAGDGHAPAIRVGRGPGSRGAVRPPGGRGGRPPPGTRIDRSAALRPQPPPTARRCGRLCGRGFAEASPAERGFCGGQREASAAGRERLLLQREASSAERGFFCGRQAQRAGGPEASRAPPGRLRAVAVRGKQGLCRRCFLCARPLPAQQQRSDA